MAIIFRKSIKIGKAVKYFLVILLGVLFTLSFFILGYKLGIQKSTQTPILFNSDFSGLDAKIFWQTWKYIKENFADPSKIDSHKAAFEAARGLIRSLDDPYSDLLTERQGKIFEEDLSGSFGGVGIEIGIRKGFLTVISPLEGTPAYRAGLKPNDQILKINGESTENMNLEEAVSKIRGEPGTKVVLTIMRESFNEPKDFELIREKIVIPTIKSEFIEPDIGYIKINTFIANTYSDFTKALIDLSAKGAQKFIIDLRNNPGGYLEVALKMAEVFVPRGKVLVGQESKNEKKLIRSEGPGVLSQNKVVILINNGSASASEIFAAALKKHLNAKLIGEKSFGKGTVQQMFKINGNLLKLTIAYWLTPDEKRIEGHGLEPDIKIKDEKEGDKDAIKEKAIELLKQ
jgi:carboxyl-terminal processing protease